MKTLGHQQDEKNCTMLQGFEWYCPGDQKHWQRLKNVVPTLAALGITSIWIPPATKELSQYGNGYGIYDLWDLGKFDQKGSVATKWGPKGELVDLAECASAHGIAILFDFVLNHKAGADYTEMVIACKVDTEGNCYVSH
jgi:alpha-amylase